MRPSRKTRLAVAAIVAALLGGCGPAAFGLGGPGAGQLAAKAATSKKVRAIAAGHRLDFSKLDSEAAFEAEMDRVLGEAAKQFDPAGHNLVVFGEGFGVMTAMIGPDYAKVRNAPTMGEAFAAIGQIKLGKFLWYKGRYGLVSNARALFLSMTDELYTPFTRVFSKLAARHRCYLVASTMVPEVRKAKDADEIKNYGASAAVPAGKEVYNTAFFWGPDGKLVGTQRKVNLTGGERDVADLSAAPLGDLKVFDTPFGKVGIAICLDAFKKDVVQELDRKGAQILLQPSFNGSVDGGWATTGSAGMWQPREWLGSTLGALQPEVSRNIRYVVNPMTVGKFFEEYYDGQSSISKRSDTFPTRLYVGVDPLETDPDPTKRYRGEFLALGAWSWADPAGYADPATGKPFSLDDRIRYLRGAGRELIRGGSREGRMVENIVSADLVVD